MCYSQKEILILGKRRLHQHQANMAIENRGEIKKIISSLYNTK